MSNIKGWYYLHTNHELIFKHDTPGQEADIRESDFAVGLWAWTGTKDNCWSILVEGLAAGADLQRIKFLSDLWECDDKDAEMYAAFLGIVLGQDGNQKTAKLKTFENLQESHCGFGDNNLQAMADLCKSLGYKPGKMWNPSFQDIIKRHTA